jgi:ferritin-like metal-binding protein YciE
MARAVPYEWHTLAELYVDLLRDLYDAEVRLGEAMPRIVTAAGSPALEATLRRNLEENREQVWRLEKCFEMQGMQPDREYCKAMVGLLEEMDDVLEAGGDDIVRDAAIITVAQRIEHYQIALYGTCRTFAQRIGMGEAANLLRSSLNEQYDADVKLTTLAEEVVNPHSER